MIDSTAAIYQAGTVVEEESVPIKQAKPKDFLEKEDNSQIEGAKIAETKSLLPAEDKEQETVKPEVAKTEEIKPKSTVGTTNQSQNLESSVVETKAVSSPKPEEPKKMQLEGVKPKLAEPKATIQQIEEQVKTAEPKTTIQPKAISQPNIGQQKIETKNIVQPSAKNKTDSTSSNKTCQYYFGYLGQREKGEVIPSSCVECAKSLDCMLAEYYKSKETVEEIRKWYRPKL